MCTCFIPSTHTLPSSSPSTHSKCFYQISLPPPQYYNPYLKYYFFHYLNKMLLYDNIFTWTYIWSSRWNQCYLNLDECSLVDVHYLSMLFFFLFLEPLFVFCIILLCLFWVSSIPLFSIIHIQLLHLDHLNHLLLIYFYHYFHWKYHHLVRFWLLKPFLCNLLLVLFLFFFLVLLLLLLVVIVVSWSLFALFSQILVFLFILVHQHILLLY